MSIALVGIMLVGVIMAGVDQVVKLDGQLATVIDTLLFIARAILAVLYSRVIHSLRDNEIDQYATDEKREIDEVIADVVKQVVQESLATMRQEIVSPLETNLSQNLDERLTALDMKQAAAISETSGLMPIWFFSSLLVYESSNILFVVIPGNVEEKEIQLYG